LKKRIYLAVTNDIQGDQRVHKTATTLKRNGWDPMVVGRRLPESNQLTREYFIHRFRLYFNKGPLFYFFYNLRLLVFLLFRPFELLVANDLDTLPGIWLCAKLRRKPFIYDSHEYFTEVPELVDRPRIKRFWKTLEQFLMPKVRYMITVNDSIAQLFVDEFSIKPLVIKNLPVLANWSNQSAGMMSKPSEKPIILYQGALNIGRGLEQMIEAMKLLPDYYFVLIGGGDLEDTLKQMVKDLELSDRIWMPGRIELEKLPFYTRMASVGISLEQDIGLNYRLSLPNKLFDYMHAGLPVLVVDLPEIARIVRDVDFGLIITDCAPINIASSINEMFDDTKRLQNWAMNASRAAQEYCWEHQEEGLLQLYEEACAKKN